MPKEQTKRQQNERTRNLLMFDFNLWNFLLWWALSERNQNAADAHTLLSHFYPSSPLRYITYCVQTVHHKNNSCRNGEKRPTFNHVYMVSNCSLKRIEMHEGKNRQALCVTHTFGKLNSLIWKSICCRIPFSFQLANALCCFSHRQSFSDLELGLKINSITIRMVSVCPFHLIYA